MKISKLFHWLYCAVMFLPLIMFLPNALYYAFNEHAVIPQDLEVNYKYQSNNVSTLDDLVVGNIYKYSDIYYDYSEADVFDTSFGADFEVLAFSYISINADIEYEDERIIADYDSSNTLTWLTLSDTSAYFYFTAANTHVAYSYEDNLTWRIKDFVFIYRGNSQGHNDFINFYSSALGVVPEYTDFNIQIGVTQKDSSITNKMYQGWQQVWDLPVFSWTHNTFFSAPFNYISALFGFQAGNSISYLLSYWFSISIIWLVFDLMIYVPLLVHRWLDKASIS